ncbi:AMP-binding protein [Arthrobacter citreus]|uniref:AMP-binding protein n=1 Tax=Arthrobacter citreus TaxID=1670 RepID=UPI0036DBE280
MTPATVQGTDLHLGFDFDQLTLFNALSARAAEHPGRVFLTDLDTGAEYTYERLVREAVLYSQWMQQQGIGRRTHVAVLLPNCIEHILIYVALSRLGAVAVPLNTQAKDGLLTHYLSNSDTQFLLHDAGIPAAGDTARQENVVPVGVSPAATDPAIQTGPAGISHEEICAAGARHQEPVEAVDPTALGYINYTSGTTGPSKGVMMPHARALLWGFSHVVSFGYESTDRVYVCLPLFHVNAFQGSLNCAIGANSRIFLRRRFSASRFWDDIRDNEITATNLLGSMAAILWKREERPDDSANQLRMVMTVPLPPYAKDFQRRFGLRFTSGYSLTDYGPSHAYTLDDPEEKLGSAGRLRPDMEARIVDRRDLEVGVDVKGELLIRTNAPWNESTGYYGLPEKTLESRRNGWFHTGDLCRIDGDGYMWFEGRLKDVIRRRGENISAFELESVVSALDGVRDVAAIAVPSELEEDEIALYLEMTDASDDALSALKTECEKRLPRYMHPAYYLPVESLPRNASHKVEKFKLREHFMASGKLQQAGVPA